MKRGFLNNKKAALYPKGESTTTIVVNPISAPPSNAIKAVAADREPAVQVMKVPYGKVKNTALPAGYIPTKPKMLSEAEAIRANQPAIITIPARSAGQPPDPDGHSEWIVNGTTKNKVINAPGYPQPVPKSPKGKSYEIKSTPTMGKGVFATRDIPMGEIIFAERPLIVSPRALKPISKVNPNDYSLADYTKILMFEREQQLEMAASRMEPETRARLMALQNSHKEDGSGPINGIVRTNGYQVVNLRDGDGEFKEGDSSNLHYYSVLCDVGSRINHSCIPNVTHAFKISAFSMVFMASRDIKAEEQLFFSYCGIHKSASDRKAELEPYGITQCICAACINATPETDTLRKTFSARVQAYKSQSLTWEQLPKGRKLPAETLDEMLRFQKAVVKEGLDVNDDYWTDFIPSLATAFRKAGKPSEEMMVIREFMKWGNYMKEKRAIRGLA